MGKIMLQNKSYSDVLGNKTYSDFLEFENLKDLNRYLKKWTTGAIEEVISMEESETFKTTLLNSELSSTNFRIRTT